MLFIILQGMVLGLVVFMACGDNKDEQAAESSKYNFSMVGNGVSRDADGVIEADSTTKHFPNMFVLGVAGDNCKLRYTAEGKTTAEDWATIAEAAIDIKKNTWENKAAGHAIRVGMDFHNNNMIEVTLPSANKPDKATVYVSGDGGVLSTKHDKVNWNDMAFYASSPTENNPHNALVIVKVSPTGTASDGKVWWHSYGLSFGEFATTRELLPVFIAQTNAARSIKLRVAEGGTASSTSNCKVGVNIDGVSRMAGYYAQDLSLPVGKTFITGITVKKDSTSGTVEVTLPAWSDTWGNTFSTKIIASSDDGVSWKNYNGNVEWGDASDTDSNNDFVKHVFDKAPYNVSWHSTATNNQALILATISFINNGHNRLYKFWYYFEGSE